MQHAFIQPNAAHIPAQLVYAILGLAPETPETPPPFTMSNRGEFSNDLAEVRLADGRTLMIKRGRYPWSRGRFHTARLASELLRRETSIVVPSPLDLPAAPDQGSLEAYWRIDLPTLSERWPELSEAERRRVMHSLGELIRRVHDLRLPGHGGLAAVHDGAAPLAELLAQDLGGRLLPAVATQWPAGLPLVEILLETAPVVARRVPAEGVLLHGDLHLGNLLCDGQGEDIRCVGLLDLEDVHAGPKESDLARLAVLHNDLFGRPLAEPFFEWVTEGYGASLDPLVLRFYRVYHLVNLGYHSASLGHEWHAGQVAAAARPEAEALRRSCAGPAWPFGVVGLDGAPAAAGPGQVA